MDVNSELFTFLMRFFKNGEKENPRYFQRLGNPDIKNSNILEIGCGTGSLAIYMVKELGAAHVLATDIENDNIAFAQANLAHNYPELIDKVEYRVQMINDLSPDEKFDCIVAKDMFEHVIDFKPLFMSICEHLKQGGRLISGFGPLYESPRGGHSLTVLPFDHLLPESFVLKRYNKKHGTHLKTVYEYGLNKLKLNDYLKVFKESGLRFDYLRMNQSESTLGKLLAATLLKLPFFRRMTFNVYLIFTKTTD
ncbi:MAG: class I SAM-dependent methyltransferase [Victivallales bacterium]|nr:class I SAM-dependent methyltransferase [Victivallales bacterium]